MSTGNPMETEVSSIIERAQESLKMKTHCVRDSVKPSRNLCAAAGLPQGLPEPAASWLAHRADGVRGVDMFPSLVVPSCKN